VRAVVALLLLLPAACAASPKTLADARSWGIQLQGFERPGAMERLVASDLDLLVLDRVTTQKGREAFPMRSSVARIRASKKLCVAYVNVGQAEDYRTYWSAGWRAPDADGPGEPGFLLATDPEGWAGNYPVAYWDPRWEPVVWRLVFGAIEEGFDGVMLDWVAGWSDPLVAAAAREAGIEPARAMARLIERLAARARRAHPGFVFLLNDGAELIEKVPGLARSVDGVVQESVLFTGEATDDWSNPKSADVPIPKTGDWSTETHVRRLGALRAKGLVVLMLEYAGRPENRAAANALARRHGFLPFTSRTPLDRLPDRSIARN
jgi:cysteinyl-tRNA synthetase